MYQTLTSLFLRMETYIAGKLRPGPCIPVEFRVAKNWEKRCVTLCVPYKATSNNYNMVCFQEEYLPNFLSFTFAQVVSVKFKEI